MARATLRWLDHRCTLDAESELLDATLRLLPGFHPERHAPDAPAPSPDVEAGEGEDAESLEYAVVRALLSQDRRHVHLHAAAAELSPGHALLVLGPSGAGKSTMARTFMSAGHRIFGDDVVALGPEGLVPFPRMVKLEGEAAPIDVEAAQPERAATLLDPGPGGWWAPGPAEVAGIIVVEWQEAAAASLDPLDQAVALRHLLDAVHSTTHDADARLDALATLAARTPAARIIHGDASTALASIAAWLG